MSESAHSGASREMRTVMLLCLGIAILTVGVFWQIKDHSFVNFDDAGYITDNPVLRQGISWESLRWAFSLNTGKYWHPATWFSLMLDYQMHGADSGAFLATNLLLHTSSAILLFLVLRLLTGALWRSAFVAALFAIHPMNVESVAWAVERKNVLSGFFWMLALLSYVNYASRPGWMKYLRTLALFIMGLLSKPVVAVLPGVLLLLDYWPLNRFRPDGETLTPRSRAMCLLGEKIPFLILGAVVAVLAGISIAHSGNTVTWESVPLFLRIQNALVEYVRYVLKSIWPVNLSCYYPFPSFVPGWLAGLSAIVLVGMTVGAIAQKGRQPYLFVGWFWFAGAMIPTSGLMQGGLWPAMADRFAYLPFIGIFIIIAWGAAKLAGTAPIRKNSVIAVVLLWIVAVAVMGYRQTGYWRDGLTLFEHAARIVPDSYFIQNNLGTSLQRAGRTDEAIHCFRESLRMNPGYALSRNNLGVVLRQRGELDAAISELRAAIDINPDYADAHNNLGVALFSQGKIRECIDSFRKALLLKPGSSGVQRNLDMALSAQESARTNDVTGK